jgi:hypothetical protein
MTIIYRNNLVTFFEVCRRGCAGNDEEDLYRIDKITTRFEAAD